jgi:hypothetical protein
MAERGAGGGKGDLDQQHELEVSDASTLGMLMSLCATKMQDQPERLSSVLQMLASFMRGPVRAITLDSTMLHPDQTGLAAKAKEQDGENATYLDARQDMKSAARISTSLPKRVVRQSLLPRPLDSILISHPDLPLLPPLVLH